MSNYKTHAWVEFKSAGWLDENGQFKDKHQGEICEHVLKLLDVFADEGHSGFSASYARNLFMMLSDFKPIAPLTGEDDEWVKHDYGVEPSYQNKRRSSVFKDANGDCYDIDGKVFWEWGKRDLDTDEEGYPGEHVYKLYYSCRESRVPVTFPYTVPEKPIYEYRHSEAIPQTPAQNEEGFL
jgi:hypothetical protein